MKPYLLWDRCLRYWLPPEEAEGEVERDINRALGRTYDPPNATFAQKGGRSLIIVDGENTTVASKIPPRPDTELPGWLTWRRPIAGQERTALLNETIRSFLADPRPHVILRTGRSFFSMDGIVLGEGTLVVVNEPGGTTETDAVRVRRATQALDIFGSVNRVKEVRKLLDDRLRANGDTGAADREIAAMIGKLKVDRTEFFDAVDLLEGVTPLELKFAGEAP